MSIENARISNVSISMSDHDCLTFWIHVDGGSWGCGIGGYCIGRGYLNAKDDFFDGEGAGLVAMMRIMDTVGVSKWEDLKGQYVRVEIESYGDGIHKIGNILKNKWFDLREFFENVQKDR